MSRTCRHISEAAHISSCGPGHGPSNPGTVPIRSRLRSRLAQPTTGNVPGHVSWLPKISSQSHDASTVRSCSCTYRNDGNAS
jgi:hypothetical protein